MARAGGREQQGATSAAPGNPHTIIGAVLTEATQLVELESQALREPLAVTQEQPGQRRSSGGTIGWTASRWSASGSRSCVWASEAARLGARSGRDTSRAVSAARGRLSIAVASTGGHPVLPCCAAASTTTP
jgi:hypothetical protein